LILKPYKIQIGENMSASKVLKFIKDKDAEFVDLRFTDTRGKLQHLTMGLQ
jgi:glutamine synthetase